MDEQQIIMSQRNSGGMSWLSILLGIWVVLSPFILVFGAHAAAVWNNVAIGGAVIILALIRTSMPRQSGWSWANVILGVWLIISPFALGFVNPAALWNNVILGVVIAIVAWTNAAERTPVAG